MKTNLRAKVTTEIVLAIIAIVISVGAIGVSIYAIQRSTIDSRYNASALDDGIEVDRTFKSSDSKNYTVADVEPCKGTLMYGSKQTSGTYSNSMQYKLYSKKSTASSYTLKRTFYYTSTGWDSARTLATCNGTTDYNVKILKYSGTSTTSRVYIDFWVD